MTDIIINEKGIQKLLTNLDVCKATGPDGIPGWLLKLVVDEITPAITHFLQQSVTTCTGNIPQVM